jgi:hypothetical protein
MTRIPYVVCMSLVALAATAQDLTVGNETETAPAEDKPAVTAKASEAAPGDEEFKPPPGFKTKKRGEIVLYCMRDSTVGTRFKTEKCYDEVQMRDYLIAQQENKRDIERVRNTCSTGAGEYCRRQ